MAKLTKEEIGRIIKDSRIAAGLTQQQVAQALVRPQNTISAWEMGRAQPDANTLVDLFSVLGRSIDEAFGLTRDDISSPLSNDALQIAREYMELDSAGKRVVKVVTAAENKRIKEEHARRVRVDFPQRARQLEITRFRNNRTEVTVFEDPASGPNEYECALPIHTEYLPSESVPDNTNFGFLLRDDSMAPTYPAGCIVFVEASIYYNNGDIGLYFWGGKAYCKQFIVSLPPSPSAGVYFHSLNPKYEDIPVTSDFEFCPLGRIIGMYNPAALNLDPISASSLFQPPKRDDIPAEEFIE